MHGIKRRNAERGQSLVEMSIGFVILIIIVMGILDLGRAYYTNLALEDAAGEAALYLALYPECPVASSSCPGALNAEYRAKNSGGWSDWTSAQFTYEYQEPGQGWTTTIPADPDVGTLVKVTIKIPFQVLTPVITAIVRSNTITLSSYAVSVIVL